MNCWRSERMVPDEGVEACYENGVIDVSKEGSAEVEEEKRENKT